MNTLTLNEVVRGVRALGLDITVADVTALPIFPKLPKDQPQGAGQYHPMTVQVLADLFRMLSQGYDLDDAIEQIFQELCEVLGRVDLEPDAPDATSAYFYHMLVKDCAWDMLAHDLVNKKCRESAPLQISERLSVRVLDTQRYSSFHTRHYDAASALPGVHRYAKACSEFSELHSYCDSLCEEVCQGASYGAWVDDVVMSATIYLFETEDELETKYLFDGLSR